MAGPFKQKDEVLVVSVGKLGMILSARRDGSYDVQVGPMRLRCEASDLKARTELSKSALKTLKGIAKPKSGDRKNPPSKPISLDLHGMRVEDAMREVERAVDRAILDGYGRMEIVHGIGAGRIREALHRYLAGLSVIEKFKLDDQNPGVTWVYF